jgi:hypothetical protein
VPEASRAWTRRLVFFAVGVGLFLLVRALWGEEGVSGGRTAAIIVLAVGFVALAAVVVATRRRGRTAGASDIARLLRAGMVDEAVRTGRELFEKSPGDPHVAWYYTAALMKSGHLAEARRVFAGLHPENLPPKMAAMYGDVRRALDGPKAT